MDNKLRLDILKKIWLFIIFLLIISAFYFIGRFFFVKKDVIPNDFLKARQEASIISQVIVNLSNNSAKRIEEISNLDNKGKYVEALNLVASEMEKNRNVREKAVSLSAQLETMAKNISGIYPESSAIAAVEAISVETTIISRLIDYNDYLNRLLEILKEKLLGGSNSHEKIKELIDKINSEAKTINELNQKFNELMAKFDNRQ